MTLREALAKVKEMEDVAECGIWDPSPEEVAELKADGLDVGPTLEVTVWKSHRNPTEVRCAIEGLGLTLVGQGSAINGPCYSFTK